MASSTPRALMLLGGSILAALSGSTYTLYQNQNRVLEENEARFDELEGTLRAHVGVIEEALERLEGKAKGRIIADEQGRKQ